MTGRRCPSCGKELKGTREGRAFPFCSLRCKTLDLGDWLDERFRLTDPGDAPPAWPGADE